MRNVSFVKTKLAIRSMLEHGNRWGLILRTDIGEGEFGALAPYFCEGHYSWRTDKQYPCGPVWEDPDEVCTYRGCGFESYSGPEPDEYESVCPNCGGHDVFAWGDHNPKFKTINFRRVRLNRSNRQLNTSNQSTNATNAVAIKEQ